MSVDAMKPVKTSAVFDIARDKAQTTARDMRQPLDDATLDAIASEADARSVYGNDAKKDRNGNFIQQGIGSPGHETLNHFMSLRRYEGETKYQAAIRKMWKDSPERAKLIGLEMPERLGS